MILADYRLTVTYAFLRCDPLSFIAISAPMILAHLLLLILQGECQTYPPIHKKNTNRHNKNLPRKYRAKLSILLLFQASFLLYGYLRNFPRIIAPFTVNVIGCSTWFHTGKVRQCKRALAIAIRASLSLHDILTLLLLLPMQLHRQV